LLEEKDIQLVTVTKDLLIPQKEEKMNHPACHLGYPDYNASTSQGIAKIDLERKSPKTSYFLNLSRGETISELSGTNHYTSAGLRQAV